MNKYIIIIAFLLSTNLLYTQQVSIDFSVTCSEGKDLFENDSIICIPTLHIEYFNNSDKNVYFKKHSYPENGIPEFVCSIMFNTPIENRFTPPDYLKSAKNAIMNFEEFFAHPKIFIYISSNQLYDLDAWGAYEKDYFIDENRDEEYMSSLINCYLADIYSYITHKYNKDIRELENNVGKMYFTEYEITEFGILNLVNNKFIFLKPYESHSDSFNLIGFQYFDGLFSFKIESDLSESFVKAVTYWDTDLEKWINPELPLPPKVGEYELYQGKFVLNELIVKFPIKKCDDY